nr:Er associated dnaj chaperone [Flammulina filiformis]
MESNKDEAVRCLAIAQKHRDAGNYTSARKFVQKSMALFETAEATKLLASINAAENQAGASSSANGSSSSAEARPSDSKANHRTASSSSSGTAGGMGGEKREYTTEQVTVVKRVRTCKVTDYYEILAVSKSCSEADVRKAYRKLALALHPDKNGAPGADEAFKMVSKAFQVLSDTQKRAIYDQSGSDPEDRSAGMPSRSSGFATRGGGGFEGELSPEDLFNMFFGGGGTPAFGSGFGGGGPVFTTTFGPGGFRTTRMGAGMPRGQPRAAATDSRSAFIQILPLLILFALSILTNLPSLFGSSPVPDPRFSFSSTARYNAERTTNDLGVKYFVNPTEWTSHPVVGPEVARQKADKPETRGPAVTKFERVVEMSYAQDMLTECQRGQEHKSRRKEAEVGLFGFGTDWDKVRKIESEVIPSCVEYERLRRRR